MTPGQRGHLQNVLAQHLQLQVTAVQSGAMGILADARTIYRTSVEWLRLAGISNPERLVIDPDSPPAQQAVAQQGEQARQAQAQQEALLRFQLQLAQEEIASRERIAMKELEYKYYDTNVDADLKEAEITGKGVIELEKSRPAISKERIRGTDGTDRV
jgi:hypothetical protein